MATITPPGQIYNYYGVEGEIRTHDFTDLQSGALDHSATSTSYFGARYQIRTGTPIKRRVLSPLGLPVPPISRKFSIIFKEQLTKSLVYNSRPLLSTLKIFVVYRFCVFSEDSCAVFQVEAPCHFGRRAQCNKARNTGFIVSNIVYSI